MIQKKVNKKAVHPVVAVALLLVVSVVAVVGFQGWFSDFSSSTFTDVEKQSDFASDVEVDILVGNKLYLNNKKSQNTTIKIILVDNVECDISQDLSGNKLSSISIEHCLENVTSNKVTIGIFTDNGIQEKVFSFIPKPIIPILKFASNIKPSNFTQVLSGVSFTDVETNGKGVWVALTSSNEILYRSSDNGLTWNTVNFLNLAIPSFGLRDVTTDNNGTWMAIGWDKSYISSDEGLSWSLTTGSPPAGGNNVIRYGFNNSYMKVDDNGYPYSTFDLGATWSRTLPIETIRSLDYNEESQTMIAVSHNFLKVWRGVAGGVWSNENVFSGSAWGIKSLDYNSKWIVRLSSSNNLPYSINEGTNFTNFDFGQAYSVIGAYEEIILVRANDGNLYVGDFITNPSNFQSVLTGNSASDIETDKNGKWVLVGSDGIWINQN